MRKHAPEAHLLNAGEASVGHVRPSWMRLVTTSLSGTLQCECPGVRNGRSRFTPVQSNPGCWIVANVFECGAEGRAKSHRLRPYNRAVLCEGTDNAPRQCLTASRDMWDGSVLYLLTVLLPSNVLRPESLLASACFQNCSYETCTASLVS